MFFKYPIIFSHVYCYSNPSLPPPPEDLCKMISNMWPLSSLFFGLIWISYIIKVKILSLLLNDRIGLSNHVIIACPERLTNFEHIVQSLSNTTYIFIFVSTHNHTSLKWKPHTPTSNSFCTKLSRTGEVKHV
jgi:hypothetical protein